jgi:energy-coupling factor transport system permease protein
LRDRETFASYHPVVNLLFFTITLSCTMVFTHPVLLTVSLLCSLSYALYIHRKKAARFSLLYLLPTLIITALINPAFNHEGGTILTYLHDGNPLTMESIVYGIAAAVMLISVVSWFSCFMAVMTSDKLIYLFGRIIPSLSLIISMSLRLVPRFKAQMAVISTAQKCVGRGVSSGGLLQRARNGIRILSILVTWALENAIETADSMKSRGYGLPGRTAFSLCRFDKRDAVASVFFAVCAVYILAGMTSGHVYFRYFPTINGNATGVYPVTVYLIYTALCASPVLLNLWEASKWKAIEKAMERAIESKT